MEFLKTGGEILTNFGTTLLTIMVSLLTLGAVFLCKHLFDYNMEEIKKGKALSKIFKGDIKINNFFKHSYFIEKDDEEEVEEEIIEPPYDNSVFSCEEEEKEYKEVYENSGGFSFRKNPEHEYSDVGTTTYTDYSTDITDSSDYTRTDYTMTATGEEGEICFQYDFESIEIDSEIQIMNILEKIKKNHDNELIKGKV